MEQDHNSRIDITFQVYPTMRKTSIAKPPRSFFETAHGKGPFDGVGGEVKRAVWRSILQNNTVVTNPEEFVQTAQKLCKKVKIVHVPKPVIQEERGKLQERWHRCKVIPQTHSVHFAARASASTLAKRPCYYTCTFCVRIIIIKVSRHWVLSLMVANFRFLMNKSWNGLF